MRRVCLLFVGLFFLLIRDAIQASDCPPGYNAVGSKCEDMDDCVEMDDICGDNSVCNNTEGSYFCTCKDGFTPSKPVKTFTGSDAVTCKDLNECTEKKDNCGDNSVCNNTVGSYFCSCQDGFISSNGNKTFEAGHGVKCEDLNECSEKKDNCRDNAVCNNTVGSYFCSCQDGFIPSNGNKTFKTGHGVKCEDLNECSEKKVNCRDNAVCNNVEGSYYCTCNTGFISSNGGKTFKANQGVTCEELNCKFLSEAGTEQISAKLKQILEEMRSSCMRVGQSFRSTMEIDLSELLQKLLNMIDELLSAGPLNNSKEVTALLEITENVLKLMGPLLPNTTMSSNHTQFKMLVRRGDTAPQGQLTLASDGVQFNSHWETAAGDSYLGFATAALLRYKNLKGSVNDYFNHKKTEGKENLTLNSDVVTAVVTNSNTAHLKKPIHLTFSHLEPLQGNLTCVFWNSSLDGGEWSSSGCTMVTFNASQTVCSCTHLSSFAVLMALYEKKDVFELQLITWIGLSLSLICLFICILTFRFVRSIQNTRTTIHLHLCISLFIANLVFLAGITQTQNRVGCGFVAGLMHFFYLAAFCWMCLEGVQLFRMVVLVFNTTLRPLYLMAGGYGIPALIVAISAIANIEGYGTERHCWLNLKNGFIWSFFGPVCLIIVVNIVFFLITVWKLAQKFSSLNQDMNKLHKIKSFTITAIAQLCVLGTMWIFGCFQFEEQQSLAVDYIFTILNSLQGVLVFIMHCLFSKQVRDEYAKVVTCVCAPQKRKYSEFSTNQTSKSQGSGSAHHTGESNI